MKLLVITDSYPPHHSGGYELRCRDVLQGLIERGHEIEIITTQCPSRRCKDHYNEEEVYRVLHKKNWHSSSIYARILYDYLDMRFIDKKVRDFQPDMIYLWHIGDLSNAIMPYCSNAAIPIAFDDGGLGSVLAAKRLNRELYFSRTEDDSKLKKWLKDVAYSTIQIISLESIKTKWSWPRNMRLCFNSEYSKLNAQENDVPVENCKIIHSGIDISKFHFKARVMITSPVKILTPGRISPEKGMKDSLLLLSKLKETNTPCTLTLIGKEYSTSHYLELLREIEKLGLEKEVRVLPMVDHHEMSKIYQEMDICFFPSYQKYGLSRVPLEAMSSGCLVITYGNEGSNEIIRNGETGYIVHQGDIDASLNHVQEAISDQTKYRRIVQNARLVAEQNHSMEAYIDAVEEFLSSDVAQSPPRKV